GVARRRVAHSVRAQDLGAVVKILLAAAGVAQRQPRPLEQALARAAKPDLFRLLGRRPSTPQALAVSIPARGADVDARKNRGAGTGVPAVVGAQVEAHHVATDVHETALVNADFGIPDNHDSRLQLAHHLPVSKPSSAVTTSSTLISFISR